MVLGAPNAEPRYGHGRKTPIGYIFEIYPTGDTNEWINGVGMSENFVAMSRSNYFAVLDAQKFREDMSEARCDVEMGSATETETLVFKIYPSSLCDTGDWADTDLNNNPIDLVKILRGHLAPGSVCILHTVGGAQKLHYLNHAMMAFTREGVIAHDSQETFYDELNRLGHKFKRAEG